MTHPLQSKRNTLDRLFSKLGIASRGVSERWIRQGRVRVNGQITRNPDTWVLWPTDTVSLDDQCISQPRKRFILFHKPKDYITTHSDEKGRKTIFELLPEEFGFIHAVGRLDQATSGLLLLTNDTGISNFLTDPINKVCRNYLVTVRGEFTEDKANQAKIGIKDGDELLKCEEIRIQKSSRRETHLEIILTEGKNREIRRLLKALGHEVTRLRRVQYGPFKLGALLPGKWVELSLEEAIKEVKYKTQT